MTEPTKPPRPGDQPLPVPNDRESVQAKVRHDLNVRERVGISRYGTALQANNGRDALRDAYEEALDLACYLRQAIEERDTAIPPALQPAPPYIWDCDDTRWQRGRDGRYQLEAHPAHQPRTRAYIEEHYGPTREQA